MSDFKTALAITLPHEGGYSNVGTDLGGETYAGISRKNWPNWPGWAIIDKSKPLKRYQYVKDKRLAGLIEVFYYENFWKRTRGDKIESQQIANFLFDWLVNSGYHAIKGLQRLVGVTDDGLMGPQTLAAVNAADPAELFPKYKAARMKFLKDIITRDPSQAVNWAGWVDRVTDFV